MHVKDERAGAAGSRSPNTLRNRRRLRLEKSGVETMKQIYECDHCYSPCRMIVDCGRMIDKNFKSLVDEEETLTRCLLYASEKAKFKRVK
jgi:hypothetical protein